MKGINSDINITERIKQYLEIETNDAFVIDGPYGAGKTFYVKNKLIPALKNDEKISKRFKYGPVLVSLFGVNSVDEFKRKILFEIIPILKKNGVKLLGKLGQDLLSIGGVEKSQFFENLFKIINENVDFSEMILVVDDIDRKGKNLDLQEFYGFINDLVENYNSKVILVINKRQIQSDDNYKLLREKVEGVTVRFKLNTEDVFDDIISNYDDDYSNFLKDYKNVILNVIQINNGNLRNLKYILSNFYLVYNCLRLITNKEHLLEEDKREIKEQIINFFIPIAVEYKIGNLIPKYHKDIEQIYRNSLLLSLLSNNKTDENENNEPKKIENYAEIFSTTYFNNSIVRRTEYFDSIFQYIVGNKPFDCKKLEEEIKITLQIENGKISEKEKLLNKLKYWEYIDLGANEYRSLVSKLVKYVDQGEFSLKDYPVIFYHVLFFNDLIKYNSNRLLERFKRGILKGKDNYKHQLYLEFDHLNFDEFEYKNEMEELIKFCLHLNNEILELEREAEIDHLLQLIEYGEIDKLDYKLNTNNEVYWSMPIFSRFDFDRFWRAILRLDNSKILHLTNILSYRYRNQDTIIRYLNSEKSFLHNLNKRIEDYLNRGNIPFFKRYVFNKLKNKVEEMLSRFLD